jgi:hypothetical protein
MLLESQIKQNSYWASECVLEVYFYTFDELNNEQSVRRHLDQVWICVRRFVRASEPREEEQTLWARIAILQTFCEGALSVCSEKEQLHGHDGWSFPKIMPILRNLVDQAISRDESGEWSHSRGFIRQQLIELDQEVMADHAYMNNALCFKRYETLLGLWKMADTNDDRIMVSSIQGKIWLLSHMQEPHTRGLGMSFVPYQVDARCAYPTENTVRPTHGNINPSYNSFAAASEPRPGIQAPSESDLLSEMSYSDQDLRARQHGENSFGRRARVQGQKDDAYNDSTELASHPGDFAQKKKSRRQRSSRQEPRY